MILFGLAVSVDSFSVGVGINNIEDIAINEKIKTYKFDYSLMYWHCTDY